MTTTTVYLAFVSKIRKCDKYSRNQSHAEVLEMKREMARQELIKRLKCFPRPAEAFAAVDGYFEKDNTPAIAHYKTFMATKYPDIRFSLTNHPSELRMLKLFDVENGKPILHTKVLKLICTQGDNMGKVATICTIGKSRTGKSFWENFQLKGLREGTAHFRQDDIIGGAGCVHFKSGFAADTKGIMVWPEVFSSRENNENKHTILIDVQGTDAAGASRADVTMLVTLAALLSSSLIFNSRGTVDLSSLMDLSETLSYCQEYQARQHNHQDLGQLFIFLVRDSFATGNCPEFLQTLREETRNHQEHADLLERIFECYEKVESFHVPQPARAVSQANQMIVANECGKDFLETLCDTANYVKENTKPKNIMGSSVTCLEFEFYVKVLDRHFKENPLTVHGINEAMIEFQRRQKIENHKTYFLYKASEVIISNMSDPLTPEKYLEGLLEIAGETMSRFASDPTGRYEDSVRDIEANFEFARLLIEGVAPDLFRTYEERYARGTLSRFWKTYKKLVALAALIVIGGGVAVTICVIQPAIGRELIARISEIARNPTAREIAFNAVRAFAGAHTIQAAGNSLSSLAIG